MSKDHTAAWELSRLMYEDVDTEDRTVYLHQTESDAVFATRLAQLWAQEEAITSWEN